MIAMLLTTGTGPGLITVKAQAPVGAGFTLDAGDLRFIFHQIEIAQAHAAGGELFGQGPNQVQEPRHPFGLRTVDGSFNHLETGQTGFGAADQVFPRMTAPVFRPGEDFDPDGPGPAVGAPTSYTQKGGVVADSQPRVISNLIADQTVGNEAAVAVAGNVTPDPLGTLPILNEAPDVGLSAPFNSMFTFFGQFFDHGLDLVTKGGGAVFVPLQADDPLFNAGPDTIPNTADDPPTNFMVLTRATNLPGPDGVRGDDPATPQDESVDDVQDATNTTTPFVDQNQTYTSHPSHQVFLRQYVLNTDGKPVATGRMIDGGGEINGVPVKNIGNWAEVKAHAATMLGIALVDSDIFNVPLLATDPYGRFLRGPNGFPIMMMEDGSTAEGSPTAPISTAGSKKTGHAFLDDIAHNANPQPGLVPDGDTEVGPVNAPQAAGTYDNELLDAHFITGDGRGNENIALTSVHTVFHAEHNRLADQIPGLIESFRAQGLLTQAERDAWHIPDPASGWDFGERLFQAARFVTEMQYQHLVFEEFARKLVPSINLFIGDGINFQSDTNPAIVAEFAHQVYRLGHSMLTETIARTNEDGTHNDIPLLDGFLNPLAFNNGGSAGTLTAAQAAGAIFQGGTRQVGNAIDEFVTEAVRNRLLGLPLDLAVLNLARGRSEGIAPLNSVRRQLHLATGDGALVPYQSWIEFEFGTKHPESVPNFVAAYGTHPSVTAATTLADKRTAAKLLVKGGIGEPADRFDFLFSTGAWAPDVNGVTTTGVDGIDLWMGGLAERISPFGGMLGSTFNYVFEQQLENLQNADRFYYLERLDGLNLLTQLEGNSFAELITRNTSLNGPPADVFSRPDMIFNLTAQNLTGPIVDDPGTLDVDERLHLVRMPDGTIRYNGELHVTFNGRDDENGDRIWSSEGDDTLRGNGGNDRMEGGAGNDQHIGGAGNDIITDSFGDDVLKGGPGNDAISGGAGPFDLIQGNEGHDFIVGGNDVTETFGGPGNDVIYSGDGATEMFAGAGDDWIEGGPQLDLLVGDENNQFQNDPNGGHDVITGGKGDDDYDTEGGDDIMVADVLGTERLEGMLGFDWVTYRGDVLPVDADMDLIGARPLNLDELRDRFDLVEALSGFSKNDILRGDSRDAAAMAGGHELTAPGVDRITGLQALLGGATSFTGGNIIMGGAGSDLIEGRGGDDLIDGDAWLNVQLEGTLNSGAIKRVDTLHDLKADVFANPQRLDPGNIRILRTIVTDAASSDIDTAVFSGLRAEYIVSDVDPVTGLFTVDHQGGIDGRDSLRNIEMLQFADGTIPAPGAAARVTVPLVVGSSATAAQDAITAAGLTSTSTSVNSTTAAIGNVISQIPAGNTSVPVGSSVALTVSLGARVPNVVGLTQTGAATSIVAAGLTFSSTTASSNAPVGQVLSQTPSGNTNAAPGSGVAVVVSRGALPAPVVAARVTRNSQGGSAVLSPNITAAQLAANTLLVAFVAADAPPPGPNTTVTSVTNTGVPLTWTNAVRSNAQNGTAEVWWAYTTVAHGAMTVTANLSSSQASSMTVMAFTGAAPSMLGAASLAANASSGAPSATLATTRPNSIVVGVGVDWDSPRVMVAGAGQTLLTQFRPTVGDTYWLLRATDPVAVSGTSVTINSTYGTGAMPDRWNLALIEIRTP